MRYLFPVLTILILSACDGHPNSDPERIREILNQVEKGEDPLLDSGLGEISGGVSVTPPMNCDASLAGNSPATVDPTTPPNE